MKARFKVEVSGSDEEGNWTPKGFDAVQYLISANPGEPLGPVEEIASGGELSRVMLALKTTIEAGSVGVECGTTAPKAEPASGRWCSTRSTPASAAARPRRSARS